MAFPDLHSVHPNSALLLYGCAFGGMNDGQFVRDALVPHVTVVDMDQGLITAMKRDYPDSWNFVCTDAILYACDWLERGLTFDVVVADPWGGGDMERAHEYLDTFRDISAKMTVVGARTDWVPPWEATVVQRSTDYCWWVFE